MHAHSEQVCSHRHANPLMNKGSFDFYVFMSSAESERNNIEKYLEAYTFKLLCEKIQMQIFPDYSEFGGNYWVHLNCKLFSMG